jgi:hypothetical protein
VVQFATDELTVPSVHGFGVVVAPENVTDPVGVLVVALLVSVTVAVQVVLMLGLTGFGTHATVVVVTRDVTVSLTEPLLIACVLSPL